MGNDDFSECEPELIGNRATSGPHALAAWALKIAAALWILSGYLFAWSGWVIEDSDLHPRWFPIAPILGLLVCLPAVLGVLACRSLAVRRDRLRCWGAFFVGVSPVCLMSGHVAVVYRNAQQRYVGVSPETLVILPSAFVLAGIEAQLRYSVRTEGERVVMFHGRDLPHPGERVREADAYIARLEQTLGKSGRAKIYWIRGSCLGRRNCSFGAFALSDPYDPSFSHLDRHELAHAVINQHLTKSSRPSMFLVEGWAEYQAATHRADLVTAAFHEPPLALATLAGPDWARIDDGPVYAQGGLYIDLLMSRFGGSRFLSLYANSHPETFASDCRRVLRAELDELEALYCQEIAGTSHGAELARQLGRLPVDDDVDREQWQDCIAGFAQAVDQFTLTGDYEARLETRTRKSRSGGDDERQSVIGRVVRAGSRKLLTTDRLVSVVDGNSPFELARTGVNDKWRLQPDKALSAGHRGYRAAQRMSRHYNDHRLDLFDMHVMSSWKNDPPRVSGVVREVDGETRTTRFDLVWSGMRPGWVPQVWHVSWESRPAVQSIGYHAEPLAGQSFSTRRSTSVERAEDGTRTFRTHEIVDRGADQPRLMSEIDEHVVPRPESEETLFKPETYGVSRAALDRTTTVHSPVPWYVAAGVVFVIGVVLVQAGMNCQ